MEKQFLQVEENQAGGGGEKITVQFNYVFYVF